MSIKHEIRANGKGDTKVVSLTARTAIQAHCKECVGWVKNEVQKCSDPHCPLYPFRSRGTPKIAA